MIGTLIARRLKLCSRRVRNGTRFCQRRCARNTEHKKVQHNSKETGSKGIKKCCRRKLGPQTGVELAPHRQLESLPHQIWGSRDISQVHRAHTMKCIRLCSVSNTQTSQRQTSKAEAKQVNLGQPTANSILFPTGRDDLCGFWTQQAFLGDGNSQHQQCQNYVVTKSLGPREKESPYVEDLGSWG